MSKFVERLALQLSNFAKPPLPEKEEQKWFETFMQHFDETRQDYKSMTNMSSKETPCAESGESASMNTHDFDISKMKWTVVSRESGIRPSLTNQQQVLKQLQTMIDLFAQVGTTCARTAAAIAIKWQIIALWRMDILETDEQGALMFRTECHESLALLLLHGRLRVKYLEHT